MFVSPKVLARSSLPNGSTTCCKTIAEYLRDYSRNLEADIKERRRGPQREPARQ